MIDIQNIIVENMQVYKIYKPVLTAHNVAEGKKLIDALELYGIKDREDIVYILNEYAPSPEDYIYIVDDTTIRSTSNAKVEQVGKFAKIYEPIPTIFRNKEQFDKKTEKVQNIESTYGVYLEINGDTIYVFHSLFDDINRDMLNLSFPMNSLKFIPVTPMNLIELQGKSKPKYDLLLLFRILIIECINRGGSDLKLFVIHENLEPKVKIYFRVDETVIEFNKFNITLHEEISMIKQIISQLSTQPLSVLDTGGDEMALKQPLCTNDIECRFTVSQTVPGYFANARFRDANEETYTLDNLKLDPHTIEALRYVSNKKSGGTFITGAMKTGKSTTLWALLREIQKNPWMCVEYSNPIEAKARMPQSEYHGNLVLLKQYLSLAKKQDINVILLNEVPNSDIAHYVRELINSNVHVLTTVHLSRVWHFPQLFATFYGEAYKDFITQMNLIVNQRIIVEQCPHCAYTIPVKQLDSRMRNYLLAHGIETVTENTGCEHCNKGELIGARKVYAEYFMFNNDVVTRLRHAENPGDMENIVKQIVLTDEEYVSKKVSIDMKVLDDIKGGRVSYKVLYDLI